MRRGLWIALAGIGVVGVAAAVVATTSAGGGGKGPYLFYSGVHDVDGSSISRVFLENAGAETTTVKVVYSSQGLKHRVTSDIAPGEHTSTTSMSCPDPACGVQVKVRSPSPLIIPSLRFRDVAGELQDRGAGTFVAIRDGKRVP